jgi:hypothetical protein
MIEELNNTMSAILFAVLFRPLEHNSIIQTFIDSNNFLFLSFFVNSSVRIFHAIDFINLDQLSATFYVRSILSN